MVLWYLGHKVSPLFANIFITALRNANDMMQCAKSPFHKFHASLGMWLAALALCQYDRCFQTSVAAQVYRMINPDTLSMQQSSYFECSRLDKVYIFRCTMGPLIGSPKIWDYN